MIGIAQENRYKHYIWNNQFYQSYDEILWCQYDEYLFEHKQMGPRHTHDRDIYWQKQWLSNEICFQVMKGQVFPVWIGKWAPPLVAGMHECANLFCTFSRWFMWLCW